MHFPKKYVLRSLLIALLVVILAAGAVVAQQRQQAATDTGIFEDQPAASSVEGEPDGPGILPNGAPSSQAATDSGIYDTGRGDPVEGPAPDDNPPAGAPTSMRQDVAPSAVSSSFSYYQVSGATLRGRSSTTAYVYDGVGCVHLTAGSSTTLILNTEAHIPDNAVIKYIRLYYKDSTAGGRVRAFLTRYSPGVELADLVFTESMDLFSGGYGFVVSQEITETVNNGVYAYTVIGWPTSPDINLQICGIRIAFYAPLPSFTFLPSISK